MQYDEFKVEYKIILNEQQDKAVQAIDGPVLVLAVPGSGKTTVLVARLGYMILCRNIDPRNILAMTYTVAATKDMHSRFAAVFGDEVARSIEIRTINSIANGILDYYCTVRKRPSRRLLTDKERLQIIRQVFINTGIQYPTKSDISAASRAITYTKNMMLPQQEHDKATDEIKNFSKIYAGYESILKRDNAIDFDDQLVYALRVLNQDSLVREYYQKKFQYICVDEAQDTSKIQHEIIRILAAGHGNLFMVGDEDQSIYSFRGAYPKALIDFGRTYNNPQILYMEKNYRSAENIVNLASRFISQNKDRYDKRLIPTRELGREISPISFNSRSEQYDYLAKVAASYPEDTAVLYRDNECAIPLIDLLLRQNIPFRTKKEDGGFFTSRPVLDMRNFLTLAAEQYNCEVFLNCYNKLGLRISKEIARASAEESQRRKIPVLDALVNQFNPNKSQTYKIQSFIVFMKNLATLVPDEAIKRLWTRINLENWKNDSGANKISILIALAKRESTIRSFIERLDFLMAQMDEYTPTSQQGLILSTVHSSKGLEYNTVYLMDVFDGYFPGESQYKEHITKGKMETYMEERRIFYVAITRAKNNLIPFCVSGKRSPFIAELFSTDGMPSASARVGKGRNQAVQPKSPLWANSKSWDISGWTKFENEELRKGYFEVKDRFVQQHEPVIDSYGVRWYMCKKCNTIRPVSDFADYNIPGALNLGVCNMCCKKSR